MNLILCALELPNELDLIGGGSRMAARILKPEKNVGESRESQFYPCYMLIIYVYIYIYLIIFVSFLDLGG